MADQDVTETLGQAESHEEPFVVTVERLAAMPKHEYEQARKAEAKRLNMRSSALDRLGYRLLVALGLAKTFFDFHVSHSRPPVAEGTGSRSRVSSADR